MRYRKMLLTGIVGLSSLAGACTKTASDTPADSTAVAAAPAAPTDRAADTRAILALDSGWMRNVFAKNVDSLMTYYTPDAVSYGFGAPANGTEQIRALYTNMVKATASDWSSTSNGVAFSDDGNMAMDHGTYSMTVTPPGGKTTKDSGAFLNVWRKVDGQWKLIAEMSTPLAPPKS